MACRTGLALALLMIGAACASSAPHPDDMLDVEVVLDIENRTTSDAVITVIGPAGARRRLGLISANSRVEFAFRWADESIQVEARLLAGGSYLTRPLSVMAGEILTLMLDPHLFRR